jgi:hypothetical protein
MAALRLHAVAAAEGPHSAIRIPQEARAIHVRDLAAIATEQPEFVLAPITPELIERHRAIVDAAFQHGTVLPAPVGVVFQSDERLTQWIDLHYVAISDALGFVEDRVGARVHVCRAPHCDPKGEVGSDIAAAAATAFRDIRRRAAAAVPLRAEHFTGIVVSSAFLVDRPRWPEFQAAVHEVGNGHADLTFTCTGPWAPYDFVQMQFGA